MKIGFPQAALVALALSASVSAQTDRSCARYDTDSLRLGMSTREVWGALDGKGDSIGTAGRPSGEVAVVRYTSRDPTIEVEYDRADIGKNRGTLVAVRRELGGDWVQGPEPLLARFGEPTDGADRLPGGAADGPVEWLDPRCRVAVKVWHQPAAWWDPGNEKIWLEIRRLADDEVPAVASAAENPEAAVPASGDAAATGTAVEAVSTPVPATVSAVPVAIAGVGGVTTPTRIPSSYVAPVYPRIASIAGLDGVVRVQARISTTGEVLEFLSVDATPRARGFEAAATEAIRQWRFTPAFLDGAPVEVLMPLVVEFKHGS